MSLRGTETEENENSKGEKVPKSFLETKRLGLGPSSVPTVFVAAVDETQHSFNMAMKSKPRPGQGVLNGQSAFWHILIDLKASLLPPSLSIAISSRLLYIMLLFPH